MGTETTATPAVKSNLRERPHDHQRVLGDVFEINECGILVDVSHDSLLGALTVHVEDCMLSQIDMGGAEHTAAMSDFSKDDDGNNIPQMLRWNNGEVWTRKRPYAMIPKSSLLLRPELENRDREIPEALSSMEVVEDGNLQGLLAHIQNRDLEIKEALSSVEVAEEVDCSIVSAATSR